MRGGATAEPMVADYGADDAAPGADGADIDLGTGMGQNAGRDKGKD